MKTYPDCVPCLLRQALKAMRLCGIDEDRVFPVMKRIFQSAMDFNPSLSPPEMAMRIHRIIRMECGNEDPYHEIKSRAIAEVKGHESRIRSMIMGAESPFRAAVRFALVGNVLDFAIFDWNPEQLDEQLEMALHKTIDEQALDDFENAVKAADSIMYLGDNAGESVFDKLLIERFSRKRVIYAVRGGPAINDVIMSDALASGLDEVSVLLSNGSDAPGTLLDHVSREFMREFNAVDLIISKGQGNYESLSGLERNIYFLTQIKCPVIAHDLGSPMGAWVIASGMGRGNERKEKR